MRASKISASEVDDVEDIEDDEEKALIPMDTTGFIGEKPSISKGGANNSFQLELDGGVVVDEMLLDGIVNSMETRRKTLLR